MKRLLLVSILLVGAAAWVDAQEARESTSHSEESNEPGMIWRWANFIILAAGLGYLASKHLPTFFRSRTESIQKGIAEAQEMKRESEQRAKGMDARMSALGSEIERFRTQAHAEMEQESARIRQETAQQIEKLQQQAEQEIESAGKVARRELKTYAAELALNLAEQRIKARLDAGTEAGLVDGFVDDLKRQSVPQQGSQN
jgi:F-type H+-transporting ATPase subunit b